MAIVSLADLEEAIANGRMRTVINKGGLSSQVVGGATSLWRQTTIPAQGAIPTTAAACNNATVGALTFPNSAGLTTYLPRASLQASAPITVEVHDRLMHMGGLSGTVTTAQTVGIDLNATTVDNMQQRRGRPDFSAVQWWLEHYTLTGTTAVTVTVTYTSHLGVTGRQTTVALPASQAAGRMLQIVPLAGDNIRSIESLILSATTGTAGNFGVTATLQRTELTVPFTGFIKYFEWAELGFPEIYASSSLFFTLTPTATNTPSFIGSVTLVQG